MKYKDARKLKVGDKFKHNKYTGIYTITDIEVNKKEVCLMCDDGFKYNHKNIKELVEGGAE